MTSRQLYEALIIELNKEQAPSLLLEEFNYFANKAVNQYINKRYSTGYDVNQQFTDDVPDGQRFRYDTSNGEKAP